MDIPDEFKNPAEIAALLMRKPNVTRADREAAAKALLEGYETRLKARLISGRRISEADAEDLISDVIMKFMANPPQKAPAEAWLFTLLRQRADDVYRARMAAKRGAGSAPISIDEDQSEDGDGVFIEPVDPYDLVASLALRRCIEDGLARLRVSVSSTLFDVLQMVALGAAIEEIASVLGMTYTNAKDHAFRARRAAQPFFKDCME